MKDQTGPIERWRRSPSGHTSLAPGGDSGFTLMEVVTVVIILGLLAAFVMSRYLEFATDLTTSISQSVANEGVNRFTNAYNQYLLDTSVKPSSLSDLSGSNYLGLDSSGRVNVGDYDLVYTQNNNILTVTVYSTNSTTSKASASIDWP
jgi:prepilin-type N-terminal cleavage/methylation domain-containing protein